MDTGRVIAEGPPDVIRADPAVIESYLGGSLEAIERSGSVAARAEVEVAAETRG
ncbi:MAG: hypothetical protein LC808_32890 [Actinobacteria bacterium]|nr:hypothetical protein [Actinomycetota bacterium]